MPLAQPVDVALLDVAHNHGKGAPILDGHLAPVDRRLCVVRINHDVAPLACVAALDGEVRLCVDEAVDLVDARLEPLHVARHELEELVGNFLEQLYVASSSAADRGRGFERSG
eukprot:CAMPEP_0179887828 /NCGR_PEP_ID=MMETSP0982-20121206/31615_1 /TAXON_ID=483367 /ORGANISM="non described non described, Strain CCMP 2436" /LENGTH=112 /DNA_ID=CAMNT_0021783687 /DNA_START=77 /DNA_END=413 /DNA_ORIENTATION=+